MSERRGWLEALDELEERFREAKAKVNPDPYSEAFAEFLSDLREILTSLSGLVASAAPFEEELSVDFSAQREVCKALIDAAMTEVTLTEGSLMAGAPVFRIRTTHSLISLVSRALANVRRYLNSLLEDRRQMEKVFKHKQTLASFVGFERVDRI